MRCRLFGGAPPGDGWIISSIPLAGPLPASAGDSGKTWPRAGTSPSRVTSKARLSAPRRRGAGKARDRDIGTLPDAAREVQGRVGTHIGLGSENSTGYVRTPGKRVGVVRRWVSARNKPGNQPM